MAERSKRMRIIYIIGVVALIAGALDPMEGSVVIAVGSILLAWASVAAHDRYRTVFTASAIMIFVGVFSLWFASSLGGFDIKNEWWWLMAILPYPLGWFAAIVTLIVKAVRRSGKAIV